MSKEITLCALYLRISRDKGENEDTLQNHREMMTDFARKNNLVFEPYEEIVSGGISDIEARPELQRLISNIEKYQAILCVSIDRLSRNGLVSQQIKQLCIDYDIEIITLSKTYDLANDYNDRIFYDMSAMIAESEYNNIAIRNKYNKIQRAKRGEWVAGGVPFGYRRNPETRKLEIYEPEAAIVRYIFKLHSEGLGSFSIRDRLNAEGYKSATGKYFELPTIKRIIKNPVYKGTLVFNDRKKTKEGGKYKYTNVETITVENVHPAIIPPKEWEEANNERVKRAEKAKQIRIRSKKHISMVSDLLFCGICGRKMTIHKSNKSPDTLYVKRCEYLLSDGTKCRNNGIKLDILESAVIEQIKKYKEELRGEIDKLLQFDTVSIEQAIKTEIENTKREQAELERKYNNLVELAVNGIFSFDELRAKKEELENKQKEITPVVLVEP